MSTGCKSSNNGFLDVSRSNGGLRISGWIGQLSCLMIFSTSWSVVAFLRRSVGSMLESTGSHGRGVERRVPEMRRMVKFSCTSTWLVWADWGTELCCWIAKCQSRFITETWWYIDFENGVWPPSGNYFTTLQDRPRSLCCWPQLPVKFHINLIHRSEDIAIWTFCIFGLKCPFRPPKLGFWRTLDP